MTAMTVGVTSIGMALPGLDGWVEAAPALRGERTWEPDARGPRGGVLPRTEARRATGVVLVAVNAANSALPVATAGDDALASVFASGEGDMDTFEHICQSLAAPQPWVSPHRFHNSVHNAPAGYWAIASGCRGSSTSLSAGEATAAAGLLEALGLILADGHRRCLLVMYDEAAPAAFARVRPNRLPFAAALLLSSEVGGPRLTVAVTDDPPSGCSVPVFEALRRSNAAAGVLPLMACLAHGSGQAVLPWQSRTLAVTVVDA